LGPQRRLLPPTTKTIISRIIPLMVPRARTSREGGRRPDSNPKPDLAPVWHQSAASNPSNHGQPRIRQHIDLQELRGTMRNAESAWGRFESCPRYSERARAWRRPFCCKAPVFSMVVGVIQIEAWAGSTTKLLPKLLPSGIGDIEVPASVSAGALRDPPGPAVVSGGIGGRRVASPPNLSRHRRAQYRLCTVNTRPAPCVASDGSRPEKNPPRPPGS
jgi:hypothetical protein